MAEQQSKIEAAIEAHGGSSDPANRSDPFGAGPAAFDLEGIQQDQERPASEPAAEPHPRSPSSSYELLEPCLEVSESPFELAVGCAEAWFCHA